MRPTRELVVPTYSGGSEAFPVSAATWPQAVKQAKQQAADPNEYHWRGSTLQEDTECLF